MILRKTAFLLVLFMPLLGLGQTRTMKNQLIVGSYTKTQSHGLFSFNFNGGLELKSEADHVFNPSYLVLNKDGTHIYAVNEGGAKNSAVSAFRYDKNTGKFSLINSELTQGAAPCHVTLSPDEKFLFAANYNGGSLSIFPINEDGSLAPLAQLLKHEGSSVNKNRQNEPHVHSTNFSPDGTILYAADLGTDKIVAYRYHPEDKKPLTASPELDITIDAGFGPRHFTFNKQGDRLYVMSEMKAYVSVFEYKNHKTTLIQEINTNAPDFKGEDSGADIHLSADGRFLYTSNRGDANSIAIFAVEADGKLNRVANESTRGKGPRNFVIDPTDNYLLVAHQYTNNIVVFKRDKKTGLLKYVSETNEVGSPVCLKFVELN